MASALLENLSAASTLAASDLFYVKQAGARGLKATGTQLLALVGTAYVPLAGGTMTGALTLPAGAVGAPSLMFTGAGATTGLYSTGANDISFAVNGSRRAYFSTSAFTSVGTIVGNSGLTITNGNCGVVSASGGITWGTSGSADTYIYRDAAAALAQRNGTTQQIFRLYRSYTDASNYSRLALGWNTTTALLTAEGLGTGSDGNIAFNDAALATGATLGYIMVPSAAGVSTGVPADIPTGQTPIVFDSTNKKIGAYTGGAWVWTAALA